MRNDSDSVKKYQEDAESWTSHSRMHARRLRPDAELTEGATNGCEDKKEFSDEIPSSIRSANVGHIAQLHYSRRLDGISFYHILSTNHLTSILGMGGWNSVYHGHNLSTNNHPSIQPLYYH